MTSAASDATDVLINEHRRTTEAAVPEYDCNRSTIGSPANRAATPAR
jgi:hypothetical protein